MITKCKKCGAPKENMILIGWTIHEIDKYKLNLTYQCTKCRQLNTDVRRADDDDVQELIKLKNAEKNDDGLNDWRNPDNATRR